MEEVSETLGAKNYILKIYEMVLRGRKEILEEFEKAMLTLTYFLRDLKGPWEISKLGS